jgi:hypothetical protein
VTPELQFACLLVCSDPAIYSTLCRVLQSFSIAIDHSLPGHRSLREIDEGNHDLIVIDCQGETYADALQRFSSLTRKPTPTVVLIGEYQLHAGGSYIFLQKPVTDWSATEALKSAYSRMLLNHRWHARHALYERVEAHDDSGKTYQVVVTDIGEGGFGLRAIGISVGTRLFLRIHPKGLATAVDVEGRVIWTREYGVVGCEIVSMKSAHRELLRDWLNNHIRVRKPLISV